MKDSLCHKEEIDDLDINLSHNKDYEVNAYHSDAVSEFESNHDQEGSKFKHLYFNYSINLILVLYM